MPESLEEMLPCAGCDGTDQNVDHFPVLGHNNALYHNMKIDSLAAYVCTRYVVRAALSPSLGKGRVPPRPKRQGGDYRPHYAARETDAYMAALEAEIGRLKGELEGAKLFVLQANRDIAISREQSSTAYETGKLEGRKESLEAVHEELEYAEMFNGTNFAQGFIAGTEHAEQAILALPEANEASHGKTFVEGAK